MIDLAEIWITVTLLLPGESPRVLDLDLGGRIRAACAAVKQQDAVGIELEWGQPTGAAEIATQPSSSDGKQFYIAWLKDRYNYNIAKLNEAYGLESTSFTDLTENDFRRVDRKRPAVAEDDKRFLEDLAAAVKQKVDDLFQACAPSRKTAWKRSRT